MMPMRKTKDIDEWNERKSGWKEDWCMRKSNNFLMFSYFRDDYFELSSQFRKIFWSHFLFAFFFDLIFALITSASLLSIWIAFRQMISYFSRSWKNKQKSFITAKQRAKLFRNAWSTGRGSVLLTQFFIWNSQLLRLYLRVIGPVRPASAAQQLRNYCIHILYGS